MRFGAVLKGLIDNGRYRRPLWPDGMFVMLVPGSTITVDSGRPLGRAMPELVGQDVHYSAHVDVYDPGDVLADGPSLQPWTPSQADMLADDWLETTR